MIRSISIGLPKNREYRDIFIYCNIFVDLYVSRDTAVVSFIHIMNKGLGFLSNVSNY